MPLHKQHRELVDHILHRRKQGMSLSAIERTLVSSGYDKHVVATALHDFSAGLPKTNPFIQIINGELAAKRHLYHALEGHLSKEFAQVQDAIYVLAASKRSMLYDYLLHVRVHFYFQLACVAILVLMSVLFSPWFWVPVMLIAGEVLTLNLYFRHALFHKLDWYPFSSYKIYMGDLFYEHLGAVSNRGRWIGPQGILLLVLCAMGVFFAAYGSVLLGVLSIFVGFLCFVSFNDHLF
jgi:hypothetical protein